jgi:hypothetical protein
MDLQCLTVSAALATVRSGRGNPERTAEPEVLAELGHVIDSLSHFRQGRELSAGNLHRRLDGKRFPFPVAKRAGCYSLTRF